MMLENGFQPSGWSEAKWKPMPISVDHTTTISTHHRTGPLFLSVHCRYLGGLWERSITLFRD